MIQQAFRVFGDGAQLQGRSDLSVVHDSSVGDTLLTGQWAHESLESARRISASIIKELQDETEVLDLLTGIREPAEQAVERLTSPVSVAACFRFASTTFQGLRFLRLVGLAQFGEPDLLVEIEDDIREEQVLAHARSQPEKARCKPPTPRSKRSAPSLALDAGSSF